MKEAKPPKFEFKKPAVDLIQAMQILYWLIDQPTPFGHHRNYVLQRDWQKAIFEDFKIIEVKENSDPRKHGVSEIQTLNRRIIKPLRTHWKFITRKEQGKGYKIFFTDEGTKMAKVFMKYDYGVTFPPKEGSLGDLFK